MLSTLQMPAGVPVATVAIGSAGARNAALLAVSILATANPRMVAKLKRYRAGLARGVAKKDRGLRKLSRKG